MEGQCPIRLTASRYFKLLPISFFTVFVRHSYTNYCVAVFNAFTRFECSGVSNAIVRRKAFDHCRGRNVDMLHARNLFYNRHNVMRRTIAFVYNFEKILCYNARDEEKTIALWSCRLEFNHPKTREKVMFELLPVEDSTFSDFYK